MSYRESAFIILLAINYVCGIKQYNLCVSETQRRHRDCLNLASLDAEVQCISALDSNDCAFKLKNRDADFALFTAEQIAFVAPVIKYDTQIIFQVGLQEARGLLTYKLRMGVVVEKNISLTTLKGKRYCHPGFGNSERNDYVMKIFESQVVHRGNCLGNRSSIENELESLTKFFGDNSCRPGRWTEDENLEADLRKRFSELCDNCHDPENCSNNPSSDNHDEAALRCVTRLGGQVAYVSIDAVKEYFKAHSESVANYSYLCPNGIKMDIGVDDPCAWYEEPLDAIVAISEHATELQIKIKDWVHGSEEWHESLKSVLNVDDRPLINFNGTPSDYAKHATGSLNITSCERPIKWCTTSSLENSKCETLKSAAALHAIKPELICVRADNVWECLKKTKENENDILGIDASLAYVADKYYDLQSVKYQECAEEDKYKTIAIVKNGTANSFEDLHKINVCFPEFSGLAHLTILEKLKTDRNVNACLDDDSLLGQFFEKTCIPSVLPELHGAKQLHDANYDCSLCTSTNCSVDTKRSYFPDAKAVECLVAYPGSAAFINANSITFILDHPVYRSQFREDEYRVMCQDGQVMPLRNAVDKSCAFETFLNGLIVGSKHLSIVQLKDIDLVFLKMDSVFGSNSKLWLFNMYGKYHGADDLLFKGKTVKLASKTSKSVDHLTGVVESVKKCSVSTERSTTVRSIGRETVAGVNNPEGERNLQNNRKSSGFAVTSSIIEISLTVSLSVFVAMS